MSRSILVSGGVKRSTAVAIAAVVAFSSAAVAQSTGRIGGIVTDASGAVVPGATVSCKNLDTAIVRDGKTNAAGIFEFPDLPIGPYEMSFTMQGFRPQKTATVNLVTGQVMDLKIEMQIGDA